MTDTPDAVTLVEAALAACPVVAILRRLQPERAIEVGATLVEEGFRVVEVPLNDEDAALRCIESLVHAVGPGVAIGAGTVTDPAQVGRVRDVGGVLVVSPDTNPEVLREAAARGLFTMPGAATPTEVFTALRHSAGAVKLFPGSALGVSGLRAVLEVVPSATRLIPVGGVDAGNAREWRTAGAAGIGIGSGLFRPEFALDEVRSRAAAIVRAWEGGA